MAKEAKPTPSTSVATSAIKPAVPQMVTDAHSIVAEMRQSSTKLMIGAELTFAESPSTRRTMLVTVRRSILATNAADALLDSAPWSTTDRKCELARAHSA